MINECAMRTSLRNPLALAVVALLAAQLGLAATPKSTTALKILPDKSQVNFLAVGKPAAIKIRGEGLGLTGQIDVRDKDFSGRLRMPLDQFKTGIELRDQHMKEKYLDVAQFPEAELILDSSPLPPGFHEGTQVTFENVPFQGSLRVKGQAKPVSGTVNLTRKDGRIGIVGKFAMKITDYPIGVPKYLGVTVAEDVLVEVTALAE